MQARRFIKSDGTKKLFSHNSEPHPAPAHSPYRSPETATFNIFSSFISVFLNTLYIILFAI